MSGEKKPMFREGDSLYRTSDSLIGEVVEVHIYGSEDNKGNRAHSYSVNTTCDGIEVIKVFVEDLDDIKKIN